MTATLLLTCCLLAQPPAQPLLTAYRTAAPPTLDGVLEEACWQSAIAAGPFLLNQGRRLPQAQTTVRATWDDSALYVGLEADEPALVAAVQQSDKVTAKVTQRDGGVFSDECLELFLGPGNTLYQLALNTIGTQYDSQNGDRAWDGTWQAVVKLGEGRYSAELALPFATFGSVPEVGEQWSFNVGRERTATPELSTWSGVEGAFMQPGQFGQLAFGQAGPGLSDLKWQNAGGKPTVSGAVVGDGKFGVVWPTGDPTLGNGTRQTVRLTGPRPSPPDLSYALVLAKGNQWVYRSGPISWREGLVDGQLTLSATGCRAVATLNGAELPPGPVVFAEGLNVLALEVTADTADSRLDIGVSANGRTFGLDSGWQRATETPSGPWRTTIETDGWVTTREWVPPLPGGQAVLRKAFWLQPDAEGFFPHLSTVYLPRGTRNLLQPYLHFPSGVPFDNPVLNLDLPAGLKYLAADDAVGVGSMESEARPEGDRVVHSLKLAGRWGSGFELSLRWGDANGRTMSYQPAITDGGTFGWRHREVTVKAPAGSVDVAPLIIKWQNRGITGTFWVDNVSVKAKGSDRELLDCGTFDEDGWGGTLRAFPKEGPDGSHCVKITCPEGQEKRQQARWVRLENAAMPQVEPGREYVISLDLKCDGVGSDRQSLKLAALIEAPLTQPEGAVPVRAWLTGLDGAVTEVPWQQDLVILPPLLDVRPQRSRIAPCYYGDVFNSDAVRAAYADNVWRSGITWTYGRTQNGVVERLPKSHKVWLSFPWEPWSPPTEFREKFEARPEIQAVGFDGKPRAHTMCPTWALANWREWGPDLKDYVDGYLVNSTYAGANWDLEQPVVDPPTFCTCDRCRAEFGKQFGVADAAKLTPDQLLKEHRDQWVEFRCGQNAQMMGHITGLMKAAKPGIEVSLYSGFQTKFTREHYGVDWVLMQPNLDVAIAGYGGDRGSIQATAEAMGDKPFIGGEMYYLSPQTDERAAPNPLVWRNRLLRQYLESGCNGVLIWYLPTMEGGAFYATSEATALIAGEEEFLAGAQRVDAEYRVSTLLPPHWFAFRSGGKTRLYLLNFKPNPVTAEVLRPDGATLAFGAVQGYGAKAAAGQTAVELAGYGCAVVELQ